LGEKKEMCGQNEKGRERNGFCEKECAEKNGNQKKKNIKMRTLLLSGRL
jgi:hypothetical protein